MGGAGSEPGAAGGTAAAAAAAGGEELQPPPPELLMASHQQTRIQAYLEKNKIGPLFEVRRAPPGPLPCPALPCSAPCPRAPPPRPAARLPLCRVAAGPEGQVPLPAQPGDAAGRERAGGLLLAGEPALGTRLSYKKLCGRRLSGRFYPQAYAWEPSFCSRFCLVLRRGARLDLEMHRCAYFTISVHEL